MEEDEANAGRPLKKEDLAMICSSCLFSGPVASVSQVRYEDVPFTLVLNSLMSTELEPLQRGVPYNLCETCINEVIRFHNFKKMFNQSAALLQAALEKLGESQDYEEGICPDVEIYEEVIEFKIEIDDEETPAAPEQEQLVEEPSAVEETPAEPEQEQLVEESSAAIHGIKLTEDGFALEGRKHIYQCSCQKQFALFVEYTKHRRSEQHPRARNHQCNLCHKRFFSRCNVKQHMLSHTKEKPYECDLCSMRFSIHGNLTRHMKRHTGEYNHRCEVCGKGFIQRTTLTAHMRGHTGERPYMCELCGKGFIQKPHLTLHARTHTNEKPFMCEVCGKAYSQKFLLVKHMERHKDVGAKTTDVESDGDVHQCHLCEHTLKSNSGLRNHLLTHGERTFLCSTCGKSFHTKAALITHNKIHTGEKRHSCPHCARKFAHYQSLKSHLLAHTGEKPYVCNVCGKKCTQSAHLKTHSRIHTGERPYVCPYCHKSFPHNGTLIVHKRLHTGETPYMCDLCPKGFNHLTSLKKHKESHKRVKTKKSVWDGE